MAWYNYDPAKERRQWNQVQTGAKHSGGSALGLAASEAFAPVDRSPIWLIIFLVIALAAHYFVEISTTDIFTFERVVLHALIAFIFCPFVLGIRLRDRFVEIFTVFMVALFLPVLLMNLSRLLVWGGINLHVAFFTYITNILFVPIWIYYALFQQHVDFTWRGRSVKEFIGILIMLFWVLLMLSTLITNLEQLEGKFTFAQVSEEYKAAGKEALAGIPAKLGELGSKISAAVVDLFRKPIMYAVGEDYYVGQVEQGKAEPLGVYIVDMKPSASKFYVDEPVSVWAVLKARLLDPEKTIKVTTECFSVPEQIVTGLINKIIGDANPEDESSLILVKDIANFEYADLSCEFPSGRLGEGSKKVSFSTNFNFMTDSYYKVYFMDKERIKSLERQSINPITYYGITEPETTAVFTNGPVGIGMQATRTEHGSLVPITGKETFKFGFTLENRWEGGIQKINGVIFKIPEGLSIESNACDFNVEELRCSQSMPECEGGKYTKVYQISQSSMRDSSGNAMKRGLDDINRIFSSKEKKFVSFNCKVKADNADTVLGNTPLAINYFKISADYDYQLEKSTAVNIKRPEGFVLPKTAEGWTPGPAQSGAEPGAVGQDGKPINVNLPSGDAPKDAEAKVRGIWDKYKPLIIESSDKYLVKKYILVGVIGAESAGDPNVISHSGAAGIAQFLPYKEYFDPVHQCCIVEEGEDAGLKRCDNEIKRCRGSRWCAEGGYQCSPNPGDPLYDARFDIRSSILAMGKMTSANIKTFSKYRSGLYLAIFAYNQGSGGTKSKILSPLAKRGITDPTWEDISEQISLSYPAKKAAMLKKYVLDIIGYANLAKSMIEAEEGTSVSSPASGASTSASSSGGTA